MNKTPRYGVIGNPIDHSLSPVIHRQFAAQFGLAMDYQKYQVEPFHLATFIGDFFAGGGCGLNVTLPYKQTVISLVDDLTENARLVGSVNTLLRLDSGALVGDSTDGAGFIHDLQRHGFEVNRQTLLLVGAGGAAQPVLVALLKAGAKVKLLNRSTAKAEKLVKAYAPLGEVALWQDDQPLDGLISAVSQFNTDMFAPLSRWLTKNSFCYDLNYGERAFAFLQFARAAGCERNLDGIGMLLGQAAESFRLWTGRSPDIDLVDW
jgi:shikimate dehydrogenase